MTTTAASAHEPVPPIAVASHNCMYVYLTDGHVESVPDVGCLEVRGSSIVLGRAGQAPLSFARADVLFASRDLISPPVLF